MDAQLRELLWTLVGSIAAGGGLFRYIPRWVEAYQRSKHRASLENIQAVYRLLTQLRHETSACRVAIVESRNGGGVPTAAKPLHCRSLYEVSMTPSPTGRQFWTNEQQVDAALADVLAQLAKGEKWSSTTEKLEPGMLRTLAEGFSASRVIAARVKMGPTAMKTLLLFMPEGSDESLDSKDLLVLDDVLDRISERI